MGVQDYRCSVCSEPSTYTCGEAKGEECEEEGFGNDQAVLDLFYFDAKDAPERPEDFEARRGQALKVETRPFEYDWGDWEFKPSLNYRSILMGEDDRTGVWRIRAFDPARDEGSPVGIDLPDTQRVWAVNYCPPCHALFAEGKTPEQAPCREYLFKIAEHLGLPFDPDDGPEAKAPFVRQVRERVARRRPAAR